MTGCGLGAFRLLLALGFLVEQRLLHGLFPLVACGVFQLGLFRRWPQTCHLQCRVPTAEALLDECASVYLAGAGRVPQHIGTADKILCQLLQRCVRVFFGKGRVPRRQRVLSALGDLPVAPALNIKMLVGVEMAHGHTPPYGDVAVRKNADESRQRTLLPSSQRRSAAANKFSFV